MSVFAPQKREPFRPCLSAAASVSTPTQPDDISAAKKPRLEILISIAESSPALKTDQ
jgi:hypothetical protein